MIRYSDAEVVHRHLVGRAQARQAFDRIQAEIERLTRDIEHYSEKNARLATENVRLRAAQAEAWDEVEVQRREVEQLRFAAENAHQDIERWRSALQTIQELAATSSLRVFHTIASDALRGLPAK